MRCPECHATNEADAAACSTCGLLLFKAVPKRRSEDFAVQKRRETDRDNASCQYCGGEIASSAIRCRHCSEIVNDQFYRERARRIRSRVNYASWIAYLFGLAALLLFRPVGLLSIAAGLLLSIAYYAIPVEPPQSRKKPGKPASIGKRLRRQFGMERVAIPIPHLRNKKLVFVGTPLVAALIGYSANLFLLQEPINDVMKESASYNGMSVSASKGWASWRTRTYSSSSRAEPCTSATFSIPVSGPLGSWRKKSRFSSVRWLWVQRAASPALALNPSRLIIPEQARS